MSEGGAGAGSGRRLVLLRHAKSAWPDDAADHERPLAKRGRRDAPLVGHWLGTAGFRPDMVICSTARRARETWELAAEGLAGPGGAGAPAAIAPVRLEPRVYEATALSLLMLVRGFDPGWHTVLMVGHNPGLAELTLGLAGGDLDPPEGFPTAFVAALGLPGEWAGATPGEGRLLAFAVPASLSP